MPRIRSIKPQFWLDEKLGKIPRDARLLYIGLWNLSDDQGVFEWRPERIKIQLFPYDTDVTNANLETWLTLLVDIGDVVKFQNGSDNFGYIPTFLKHQEIKNPSKWKFAEIPTGLINSTPALTQGGVSATPALTQGVFPPNPPDSPPLNNPPPYPPLPPVGSRSKGVGSREKEKEKGTGEGKNKRTEETKEAIEHRQKLEKYAKQKFAKNVQR